PEGPDPKASAGGARDPRHPAAPQAQAPAALRRPAAAGRGRARDRASPAGVPLRRAALQPGRKAPRPDARRAEAAPRAARDHRHLRDPRPGRGDDARRSGRRHEGRLDPAGRRAARAVREAGEQVRRRVHRLARDELRRREGRRRQRRPLGRDPGAAREGAAHPHEPPRALQGTAGHARGPARRPPIGLRERPERVRLRRRGGRRRAARLRDPARPPRGEQHDRRRGRSDSVGGLTQVRPGSVPHGPAQAPAGSVRRREILVAYALLTPAVLLVLGVLAYPVAWEVWISLTSFASRAESRSFVGVANYRTMLADAFFWRALATTVVYFVVTTLAKLAVGVALALLLARPCRGRALVFLAVFLPWAYPGGVTVVAWYWMLNPPLITSYSVAVGHWKHAVDGVAGAGAYTFASVALFNIWRGASFTAVFLLAGLNAIPRELFDYARLETRSAAQRFRHVTLPLLRPFLALAVFLSFPTAFADLANR